MSEEEGPVRLSVATDRRPRLPRRIGGWAAAALVLALALYYPVGAMLIHAVDDDPDFAAETPAKASRTVAIAAALIEREVDRHRWVTNDPFFLPGAVLDNMSNYQQGMVAALARFAVEMTDHIGRTRGASPVDRDLDRAAGLLKYPGNVWFFDPGTSFAPTASSESQYRAARRALLAYNERLGLGKAVFERRADNLLATLERIAADIGAASAALDRRIAEGGGPLPDFAADDAFYATKGRMYAYYLLLRELGQDFERVIGDKELRPAWAQMVLSFRAAASLSPWVVINGRPDSGLLPSHLAAQGFYVLRARTQLYEVANILLK